MVLAAVQLSGAALIVGRWFCCRQWREKLCLTLPGRLHGFVGRRSFIGQQAMLFEADGDADEFHWALCFE